MTMHPNSVAAQDLRAFRAHCTAEGIAIAGVDFERDRESSPCSRDAWNAPDPFWTGCRVAVAVGLCADDATATAILSAYEEWKRQARTGMMHKIGPAQLALRDAIEAALGERIGVFDALAERAMAFPRPGHYGPVVRTMSGR